jgi:hypothetical protein
MNINKIFHRTPPKPKKVTAMLVARFIAVGNCVQRQLTTGIELIANEDTGINKTNITKVRIVNLICMTKGEIKNTTAQIRITF